MRLQTVAGNCLVSCGDVSPTIEKGYGKFTSSIMHSPGPMPQGFLCRVSEVRSLTYMRFYNTRWSYYGP
jgi:hypothetical protein